MIAKNARDVGWVWKSRTIHRHWGHLWGGSTQHGNLRHQALETCLKITGITEACLLFLFVTPMKVDEVEYQIKPSDPAHTFIPVSKVSHSLFPSEIQKMPGFFLHSSFVIRECFNMTYLALHEKPSSVSASNFKMVFIHSCIHSFIQHLFIEYLLYPGTIYCAHHLVFSFWTLSTL